MDRPKTSLTVHTVCGRDDDGGKFAFINSDSYHPSTRKLHSSHEVAKITGGGGRPALPVWLPYQPWQSTPLPAGNKLHT
jgi:hypothetical protein